MAKRKETEDPRQAAPLSLDAENEEFLKGEERLHIGQITFEVLRLLIERRPRVVTKDEFYEAVWQPKDKEMTDWTLTSCMSEVRGALGDLIKPYQYIETKPGKGYRFIGPVTVSAPPVPDPEPTVQSPKFKIPPSPQSPLPDFVGRKPELEQLHQRLKKALDGERQIVFVTGEPGIGKTTLVRAFLREVAAVGGIAIGRGQCLEHYGLGEAYMPVLEALGLLCRAPGGEFFVEWMMQYAPTWLVQMPTLLSAFDLEVLQRKVQGATRERMLREMNEGIEVLTEQTPFLLVLEDLQWSDPSTLDMLAALTRRQERARLLVIGTYRPEEGLAEGRPLRGLMQELRGHEQCHELAISLFSEAAVEEYLEKRFLASVLPDRLPQLLYHLTEGNPLFLVTLVNDWVDRKVLLQTEGVWTLQKSFDAVSADVPDNLRQLLSKQSDRLSLQEQHLLEVASVAGLEFSAAAVATAAAIDVVEVERSCKGLADRHLFLRSAGVSEWPDGTVAARYGFRHALYQYLWDEHVTPSQRQRLNQQIGERLEIAYADQAGEIAAELAIHFEQGRDYERSVRYLQLAAQNALRRSANKEAIAHSLKGLELLKTLPETPERTQQELTLYITLGLPLLMLKGHTAPEVERTYGRAHELCQQVEENPQVFEALHGLRRYYVAKGEIRVAHELSEQIFKLTQRMRDPTFALWGHLMLGDTFFYFGDLVSAQKHWEQALGRKDVQDHHSLTVIFGADRRVAALYGLAKTLWLLGYPDQALHRSLEATTLAHELGHPFTLAIGLNYAAVVHQFRREPHSVQAQADAVIALSLQHGFVFWKAWGWIFRGWALGQQGREDEGLGQLQQGITLHQAMGAGNSRPYAFALLAEVYSRTGRAEDGLSMVAEGLMTADKAGDRVYEAELYRLKGELTLQQEKQKAKSKKQKRRPTPDP